MAKFSSITENNTIRSAFKRLHGEHGKILAVIDKKKMSSWSDFYW